MGKRMVPASKARGMLMIDTPQSTILAEDAMLLTIKMVTKAAMTRSKYL
jgi:hypothetical protein